MGVQIEYTITLGTMLEIFSILAGGLIFVGIVKKTLSDMERELESMRTEMKDFSKALVQLAVQTNRLDHIEEDIRDLRRGKGFIMDQLDQFKKGNG